MSALDYLWGKVGVLANGYAPQPRTLEEPPRMPLARGRLLKTELLPAGDVPGFDIDYAAGTGRRKYSSEAWLHTSDGIAFVGQGIDRTHIRPVGDQAILVDRHNGVVRLENLTIHCGSRQGIWFGLEHKDQPIAPKFRLEMKNVRVVADAPAVGVANSTVWGLFGYQADVWLEDVTIDCLRSAEHASYWHGFAADGLYWNRVRVLASGAEQCKVRNTPTETQWARGARIVVINSTFSDWYQPWTWRGGGGIVVQGGGCDVIVRGCLFRNAGAVGNIPASSRTRCVMIDDAGGDYFGAMDGRVGQGFANGHVLIRGCGFEAGPGAENYSPVIRVGPDGSGKNPVARTVRIEGNAIYGRKLALQLANIPAGKLLVAGNNTPAIADLAATIGLDASAEASILGPDRVFPVSVGLSR